jgi:hypothetical protein
MMKPADLPARMNKSSCFVLQYNTEALVLVLQYYFGKRAILKHYQKICLIKASGLFMQAFKIRVTQKLNTESFRLKLKQKTYLSNKIIQNK